MKMTTALFLMLYPAFFMAGAILTQLMGNSNRPFHEDILAWLFFPIGLLACLSSLATEGVTGLKFYLHEFGETLLNYHTKTDKIKPEDAHRMNEDLA